MKLRIQGNSLRLRLSPSEMTRLLDAGRIEETIHFAHGGDARLTYALEHAAADRDIDLRYRTGEIAIVLSTARTRQWAESDEAGIAGSIEVGGGPLHLLVEKDFACLDRNGSGNEDAFPNPKADAAC